VLREAQALARLQHPNVVTVYDANALGEIVYLTMELVDGASLTHWLKVAPRTIAEILAVFVDAGRGLAGRTRRGSSTATSSPTTCWSATTAACGWSTSASPAAPTGPTC
jgi:serine/threonine protein kinase